MRLLPLLPCLAAIAVAVWPSAVRAQKLASYQAANWDKETILPPGTYRAAKPVELHGKFDVKTQAGTLIDGVSFKGLEGDQHWEINGTLMRRSRIGGQLGVRAKAADSVFEDCEFNKDSGWAVSWWGTKWHFENCIFTRRFIRSDLVIKDYAAHATRCTFYGIKLPPPTGLKEDPAKYLGGEHMGFEQCRFVDCDVPEPFLAATVNCVFERCHFAPKGQFVWPPETKPIKVTAYYVGSDNPPGSFLNKALTVEFLPVPKDFAAGSTLPHTQTGGRVTLTNARFPEQAVTLAAIDRKASEFVDPSPSTQIEGGPVVLVPDSTGIPGAAPSPKAPAAEIHTLDEVLAALPGEINVLTGGEPNLAGIQAANAWLAKTFIGRPAAMRVTLEGTQNTNDKVYSYQAVGAQQGVLFHGATIPARTVGLFRAPAATALARVQRDADFNLRGTVQKAEFIGRGRLLTFTLTVGDAQVQ